LHVEIGARIEVGELVIDEEFVTGFVRAGSPPRVLAAAVYQVADQKIQRVQLFV